MIYQLKISLKHTKPPIWRRILVDAHTTFDQLHTLIQIAFDWSDEHYTSSQLQTYRKGKVSPLRLSRTRTSFSSQTVQN